MYILKQPLPKHLVRLLLFLLEIDTSFQIKIRMHIQNISL
jgi:hypothetical protein